MNDEFPEYPVPSRGIRRQHRLLILGVAVLLAAYGFFMVGGLRATGTAPPTPTPQEGPASAKSAVSSVEQNLPAEAVLELSGQADVAEGTFRLQVQNGSPWAVKQLLVEVHLLSGETRSLLLDPGPQGPVEPGARGTFASEVDFPGESLSQWKIVAASGMSRDSAPVLEVSGLEELDLAGSSPRMVGRVLQFTQASTVGVLSLAGADGQSHFFRTVSGELQLPAGAPAVGDQVVVDYKHSQGELEQAVRIVPLGASAPGLDPEKTGIPPPPIGRSTGASDPLGLIHSYYQALSQGSAEAMQSREYRQAGQGERWKHSRSVEVEDVSVLLETPRWVLLRLVMTATFQQTDQLRTERYEGSVRLVNEDGGWRLDRELLRLVDSYGRKVKAPRPAVAATPSPRPAATAAVAPPPAPLPALPLPPLVPRQAYISPPVRHHRAPPQPEKPAVPPPAPKPQVHPTPVQPTEEPASASTAPAGSPIKKLRTGLDAGPAARKVEPPSPAPTPASLDRWEVDVKKPLPASQAAPSQPEAAPAGPGSWSGDRKKALPPETETP